MIRSINPASGDLLLTFDAFTPTQIEEAVRRAFVASRTYRTTTFTDRAQWLHRLADLLDEERESLGEMMTSEMGKPITAAVAEAEKCATVCRFYADKAEEMLRNQLVVSDEKERGWVAFQPLGVVLAVMPWNFPFWQVFRFAAPALMAGNVGLLKHASNVPQSALAIETLIRNAGFPANVFQTLLIGSTEVEGLIADPRIAAVTLTGSEGAGRSVAAAAGKHLKKGVFELGGSDPFIVMPSADLESAVSTAVQARMINNGQSCIAAKRFIVHRDILEAFESRFVEKVQALRVGNPMDRMIDIGPLATADILRDLHSQVERTVALGAEIRVGGQRLDRAGNFYAPTVLTKVPKQSPAAVEELFGPVAPIIEVQNIDEAIAVANSSSFGLGSSAWTNDADEQLRFVEEIDAGTVVINGMVISDPRYPFGGIKHSGFGRELSEFGIREFVNIKAVRTMIVPESATSVTE